MHCGVFDRIISDEIQRLFEGNLPGSSPVNVISSCPPGTRQVSSGTPHSLSLKLDAVYIDAKKTKAAIAVKPKPPFRPVFQVASQREGPSIRIYNGFEELPPNPPVFLVETGESRTLPETILRFA